MADHRDYIKFIEWDYTVHVFNFNKNLLLHHHLRVSEARSIENYKVIFNPRKSFTIFGKPDAPHCGASVLCPARAESTGRLKMVQQ